MTQPELRGILIERVYNQRAAADQPRSLNGSNQCVTQQPGADTAAHPSDIGRQLTEQKTRNRSRWLASLDGPRHHSRDNRGGREAVVTDYAAGLVDHNDDREALLLVRQGAGLEPVIERGASASEGREVVARGQKLRGRQHCSSVTRARGVPGRLALQEFDDLGHDLSRRSDRRRERIERRWVHAHEGIFHEHFLGRLDRCIADKIRA